MTEIKRIEGIIEQQKRFNQERNYITIASKEKQIERLKETLVIPDRALKSVNFPLATTIAQNSFYSCDSLKKAESESTRASESASKSLSNVYVESASASKAASPASSA